MSASIVDSTHVSLSVSLNSSSHESGQELFWIRKYQLQYLAYSNRLSCGPEKNVGSRTPEYKIDFEEGDEYGEDHVSA
jgi:hypothetical protein